MHLIGADGRLLATGDGPPIDGRLSIGWWPEGLLLRGRHAIALPSDLTASELRRLREGRMELRVGLYDLASGIRWPAFDPAGQRLDDEAYAGAPRIAPGAQGR